MRRLASSYNSSTVTRTLELIRTCSLLLADFPTDINIDTSNCFRYGVACSKSSTQCEEIPCFIALCCVSHYVQRVHDRQKFHRPLPGSGWMAPQNLQRGQQRAGSFLL
jgi:hypothetical protein